MAITLDYERTIHSVKTALAVLLGLIVASLLPFHADQWLIITILVVMCAQINVGSMLTKSSMRFVGTSTGSIIAALTLFTFGVNPAIIGAVIASAAILFSYIATGENRYSDAGTLGAVTITVILLGQNPTIVTAWQRFVEISLGIVVAALVSQFVLPIRARDHLHRMQAITIEQLKKYYEFIFIKRNTETDLYELDETIVKSLSAQRSLAKQSAREPFGEAFNSTHFNKLLHCEKEIFRSISCMHYAGDMLPKEKNVLLEMPVIKHFHQTICDTFDKISHGIIDKNLSKVTVLVPSVQPIKDVLHDLRVTLDEDDVVYLDGLVFCAEILVVQLTEMVLLFAKSSNIKEAL
ncbi:MAG: FUSC family protein [Pseudomonadota bacterium]